MPRPASCDAAITRRHQSSVSGHVGGLSLRRWRPAATLSGRCTGAGPAVRRARIAPELRYLRLFLLRVTEPTARKPATLVASSVGAGLRGASRGSLGGAISYTPQHAGERRPRATQAETAIRETKGPYDGEDGEEYEEY